MQTRRDFLKSAATLTGSAFVAGSVPAAVARALAIDPEKGTTFLDAERIVVLMQENRSFDHCFGALQGVRGYRDPRAHTMPDGDPVWFQKDKAGNAYAPFRLDMKGSNVTWMGGLPHSWPDQVDARHGGLYDKWLEAKPRKERPFTLGHYTREDIPFYYALADAFTVCDYAFCSSLTGTTPNRLFLWTGTIRADEKDFPRVQNGDTDYDREAAWTTFPERLEEAGVSWRVYQNEISLDSGLQGEEDAWLSNFTDNPLEWFSQYGVRFSRARRAHLAARSKALAEGIAAGGDAAKLEAELKRVEKERADYHDAAWEALPPRAKSLHERAFTTNEGDPHYRSLTTLAYEDAGERREVSVPKGDVLHGFRRDVETGALPAVSYVVAPEHFSDHPTSAWYGAWYVSEVLDILTKDPEVWKKTILVLCYDENDGWFDHVPPFTAPHPDRPETGRCSKGLDTAVDWADAHGRDHAIGLGYRCPLVVCSPWSRGGVVNSQVFDHTSVIQLVETWLAGKGKRVRETNVSDWRRTVCGDLSSTFRPYRGERLELPASLGRDATVQAIHAAKFRQAPAPGRPLAKDEIRSADVGAFQEPGTRPSNALPYELVANAVVQGGRLHLRMEARNARFGRRAQGAPFNAYAYGETMRCRAYAVRAGDGVSDEFAFDGAYHVRVDGPNGFMREFRGEGEAGITVVVEPERDGLAVHLLNGGDVPLRAEIRDEAYGTAPRSVGVGAGSTAKVEIDPTRSHGWYDFTVHAGATTNRYAGRVETGRPSTTDPAMGGKAEA